MSVAGFDFGNDTCEIGLARRKGIDVILNGESKRETPSFVSFSAKQRFLGVAGANSQSMNAKNTISSLKRLIGKKWNEPVLQEDLKKVPFKVTEGKDGWPEVHVTYMDEQRTFTADKLLAMLFTELKQIAEKEQESKVTDCVVSVPVYFTDLQRRCLLDSLRIAGLNCLRLLHETTATALSYGIYKTDLPEKDPVHVAFVDVGQSSLQCCIVAFKKGQLQVLAHGHDQTLGGRDFDEVLVEEFARQFQEKTKLDIRTNNKAHLRMRVAVEKLKKVLSANAENPLNVECLMDDRDFSSKMTRDEMEALAKDTLEKVRAPLQACINESGISKDIISHVELVGSGSRVPSIVKIVEDVFGKEVKRTLNASECVARGCALQGAMLSPQFKVREFEVVDAFPFSVDFTWKKADEAGKLTGEDNTEVIFPKNNALPCTKVLTLVRSEPISMSAKVSDPSLLAPGVAADIGSFNIGPLPPTKTGEPAKLKVTLKLNLHGCVNVDSVQSVEEEWIEVPVKEEKKKEEKPKEGEEAPKEGEETPMETDKPEEPKMEKKKKVVKSDVPVVAHVGGLSEPQIQAAIEAELEMALQDRVMEETKDKKNQVEEYVYSMRDKLEGELKDYITPEAKDSFMSKLTETEDWLYEDGEDEIKSVYVAKMNELTAIGGPVVERSKEEGTRQGAATTLSTVADVFIAQTKDAKYEHIDEKEREKVVAEAMKAKEWLADKMGQQAALPKTAPLAVLTKEIEAKKDTLERFAKPIMSKPKPAPKPEPKAEEAKPAEAAAEGGDTPMADANADGPAPPPPESLD
mmetsp:Transcript_5156/g.5955  ORF Transcript_5156/g.5955 Transcript_5156/m.5955 type:complete len:802 (-) Transcript_5156:760-3165(-)|eukprot:CAMPEP_0197846758 /NCGR_PEP_ID=MMETSP1438-20131217/4328_1 /TAXON_ID=1461541 /ORGANISM="Pterosperma sp., Strain CCMP1384" /LENGTH=801 /DNA_ID=CAMNT_0043458517 /DNA_START=150 /DNA_END=2555 /DNA_ORIENTATION=+